MTDRLVNGKEMGQMSVEAQCSRCKSGTETEEFAVTSSEASEAVKEMLVLPVAVVGVILCPNGDLIGDVQV